MWIEDWEVGCDHGVQDQSGSVWYGVAGQDRSDDRQGCYRILSMGFAKRIARAREFRTRIR